jgi:Mobilization protein NikA
MSKGSDKRRRTKIIRIRVDEKEHAAINKLADQHGLPPPALLRQTLLNVPPPARARRPSADVKAVAQLLGTLGRTADAIRASLAELGKVNSNVNQIARSLNAGRPPERIMSLLETTLQEHFTALQLHDEILRDFLEIRLPLLQALGAEPERDHPADPPELDD